MKSRFILFLWCISSWTFASSWHNLLMNTDQHASQLMEDKQYQEAAAKFNRVDWQAAAYYRAGDYKKSASLFESLDTSEGFYNAANAYAHMGQFEKAIRIYDRALKINPENQDARFNRDLVMKLRDQQKQQQNNQPKSPSVPKQSDENNRLNQNQSNQAGQTKKSDHASEQNPKESEKSEKKTEEKEAERPSKAKANQMPSRNEAEKQQAKKQWLRMIPEPPSSLLKEKFMRDYLRNKVINQGDS